VPSKIWNGTQNEAEVVLYSIGTQCFKIALLNLWAQTEYGSKMKNTASGKAKVLRVGKSDWLDPKRPATTFPEI
jgi:hypothetical protein